MNIDDGGENMKNPCKAAYQIERSDADKHVMEDG